ncbi:hypothetical protein ARMGADRAFT_159319 [Armillaria gallica]|uniref:Uncharacterized protein n=1 Tax=Armillaria gallica TaxID=47427 RepID=A0A2H3DVS7_ARMGA|nr:hypothetical protein ARMGADRAFT_159319 [Armillaria gallica]
MSRLPCSTPCTVSISLASLTRRDLVTQNLLVWAGFDDRQLLLLTTTSSPSDLNATRCFIAAAADLDLDRVRSADRQGRVDSVENKLM